MTKDSKTYLSRRHFVIGGAALASMGALAALTGCSASGSASGATAGTDEASSADAAASEKVTFVWLPDNSAADLTSMRDAFGAAITAASGLEVEMLTTTDYNVAIEAIASGSANMGLLGAEGYVQANKKNPEVLCAFTNSDTEGGLVGACYYSRICVATENADQYKDGSEFSIDNIKGKSFSFVSATSTSGFKVPSAGIVSHFELDSADELLEAGAFFSEVLFGNSHAGSAVNLLAGDAEAAAFDDVDVDMFFDLSEGEANSIGAVYTVKPDAEAPFDTLAGKQFTIISITPVLNAPIAFNQEAISDDAREAIVEYFCSSKVSNDKEIFVDANDEDAVSAFSKDYSDSADKTCFVEVEDDWYEPIRKLGA